jgi:hypothetical protein
MSLRSKVVAILGALALVASTTGGVASANKGGISASTKSCPTKAGGKKVKKHAARNNHGKKCGHRG